MMMMVGSVIVMMVVVRMRHTITFYTRERLLRAHHVWLSLNASCVNTCGSTGRVALSATIRPVCEVFCVHVVALRVIC